MESVKKSLGKAAADLIENGMRVGLGSGSTATCFIEALALRCTQGLQIEVMASSEASMHLALKSGMTLLDPNKTAYLDITVDGADEIDTEKRMIKGRGGALVREKILAKMSKEMIVIVDETKLVTHLGICPLPVEIIPFAPKATEMLLKKAGYMGNWRAHYITDNGNYIFDIHFDKPCCDPERDEETLLHIPGVVDTGFFFNMAGRVLIGFSDGQVKIR